MMAEGSKDAQAALSKAISGQTASGPKVLLGVTGCIALYKACELVRRLQDQGADVRVVMTQHATDFVSALTFEALTHKPPIVGDCHGADQPLAHIELAEWADLYVIAPCTANVIAKLANGIADDIVSTAALVANDRIVVVPAMNVHMFEAPVTQENLARLRERGVSIVDPESGYLACGDVGKGRFPDPAELAHTLMAAVNMASIRDEGIDVDAEAAVNGFDHEVALEVERDLAGKSVLVTAGPTLEPIDPVRYVTNRSSGKMGYAIAEAAARRGAEVTLVSGPVSIEPPSGVHVIDVETASEMEDAALDYFEAADIAVFAAAVADMRPKSPSDRKLKKGSDLETLQSVEMEETDDILKACGMSKKPGQLVIGFAAETDDVIDGARAKLASKGADMIVANDVSDGKVFGDDENEAMVVTSSNIQELPKMSKAMLADRILDLASAACANMF